MVIARTVHNIYYLWRNEKCKWQVVIIIIDCKKFKIQNMYNGHKKQSNLCIRMNHWLPIHNNKIQIWHAEIYSTSENNQIENGWIVLNNGQHYCCRILANITTIVDLYTLGAVCMHIIWYIVILVLNQQTVAYPELVWGRVSKSRKFKCTNTNGRLRRPRAVVG